MVPTYNIITLTKEDKVCMAPATKRQLLENNLEIKADRKANK